MTNDVKEAAERLVLGQYGPGEHGQKACARDRYWVAHAYLAENDETPITEQFLREEAGFSEDEWGSLCRETELYRFVMIDGSLMFTFEVNELPGCTKGQFLRLCRAIGIPLNPAASEGGEW